MASIVSSLGAGSGVDMAALTTQLVEAQFSAKLARIDTSNTTLDSQISDASTLKNKIQQLASALGDRVRTGDLTPLPTIANGSVASVARLSAAAPTSGSYSLEVLALAKSQSLASTPFPGAASTVGSGTLTLHFGAVDASSFTEDTSRTPVSITIAAGSTLQDVANAITASGSGVTAYVANTTTGTKLMMKGPDGAENGFTIDATEAVGDPGLSALAWTPGGTSSAQLVSTSGDASFKLDGLEMASASNSVTTAIDGMSINLTGTNVGNPTRIGFSDPSANITGAMNDFVAALNDIQSSLGTMMNAQNGDLARDPGAQALRRGLSQLTGLVIMPGGAAGAPATLAQLGVKTNRDGSYTLDTTTLGAALKSNPQAVAAMFTPGLHGVFAAVDDISRSATTSGDPGSLAGSITRYTNMKTQNATDKSKIDDQSAQLKARLTQQFANTNSQVSAFKSTMTFLQNQIAAWNKSN